MQTTPENIEKGICGGRGSTQNLDAEFEFCGGRWPTLMH